MSSEFQRKRIAEQEDRIKVASQQVDELNIAIRVLKRAERYYSLKSPEYSEHFEIVIDLLELWIPYFDWAVKDAKIQIQNILREEPTSRWQI